jgi:hypothetical protein
MEEARVAFKLANQVFCIESMITEEIITALTKVHSPDIWFSGKNPEHIVPFTTISKNPNLVVLLIS